MDHRQIKIFYVLLYLLTTFTLAQNGWSWGYQGHRITGAVAEAFLEEDTKEKLQKLKKESLADLAPWMDRYSKIIRASKPWHYVNIPKGKNYSPSRDCSAPRYCLPWAIEHFIAILKDPSQSLMHRQEALAFVVHLIGDLHQPLHCAYGKDKGGNTVSVQFFGERMSLHLVWDVGILKQQNIPENIYVKKLLKQADKEPLSKIRQGTVLDWLKESRSLVPQVYRFPKSQRLGKTYQKSNAPIIEQQLLKAGIRIAQVLNNSF